MSHDRPVTPSRGRREDPASTRPAEDGDGSRMLARTWTIASLYRTPEANGIPALPDWTVRRTASGELAFAPNEDAEPFIRAERPAKIRR